MKINPKIDTFGRFDTHDLAIVGVKKVDFSTFSKFFWAYLGSVQALVLPSKGLLLGVFFAPKVDKLPCEILGQHFAHFGQFEWSFLTI